MQRTVHSLLSSFISRFHLRTMQNNVLSKSLQSCDVFLLAGGGGGGVVGGEVGQNRE